MTGKVYLVGAGPGDPGLLTLRAKELIETADVILTDKLVPPEALALARGEVVDVGKVGGGERVEQEETNRLLVEHATAERTVVRLKGGDPFVFGRGGEEAQVLRDHGIAYEVVPGVTAGVAAPAYAGIPVTHRGVAGAVAFVTGTESDDREVDWDALAKFPGTLVFYMGVKRLPLIAERLVAAGGRAVEPAAVIERGTLAEQRIARGPLAEIADRAADLRAPAIIVVGDVAAIDLGWLEPGPLAGRTIAVTRARPQASALAGRLRELGARVVEARPSGSSRSRRSCPTPPATTCCASRRPTAWPGSSSSCATRASSPARASRRSGREPRRPCVSTASSPTSCPRVPWPRGSSRRWARSRSGARCWSAAKRAATSCPTRCASAV